jgi:arginine deiminase
VTSEIGPLRAVLVHTPGNELLAVTPRTRKDYLYDDLIDVEFAQREHRRLVALLERFADVYETRDLLVESLADDDARAFLISRATNVVHSESLAHRLADVPPEELATFLIEGTEAEAGPIGEALNIVGYSLPPAPNLFFMRDAGVVVGDDAVVGSMRYGSRWSEELLIKVLFEYHPELRHGGLLYDGSAERRITYSLEGGDVHPLRPDLVLLGLSSRSSAAALDHLCQMLFSNTPVTDVLVVVMHDERSAIHLDMIFTQVDRGLCVVSPPHFLGPERLAVLRWSKSARGVKEMPDLFAALEAVDFAMEPILCGGTNRAAQEREQWASGCNMFAVRPGVVIGYARNDATLAEFAAAGFRNVLGVDLLAGNEQLADEERAIITLEGAELVRGGGGPRCMTLPVRREDL